MSLIPSIISLMSFAITYLLSDIFTATTVLMLTSFITSLIFSLYYKKSLTYKEAGYLTVILIGGGCTLWFKNELFLKLKPTVIFFSFAIYMLISNYYKHPVVKSVLEPSLALSDEDYQFIENSTIFFYIFLGVLNLIISLTCSTKYWMLFKIPGIILLNILFMYALSFKIKLK